MLGIEGQNKEAKRRLTRVNQLYKDNFKRKSVPYIMLTFGSLAGVLKSHSVTIKKNANAFT